MSQISFNWFYQISVFAPLMPLRFVIETLLLMMHKVIFVSHLLLQLMKLGFP